MKKLVVLLMALIVVLSACSSSDSKGSNTGDDSSENEGNEKTDSNARISLPAFSFQSSAIQDYDNNDLTKFLEEKFNVDIQWTLVPSEATLEKQNVLL